MATIFPSREISNFGPPVAIQSSSSSRTASSSGDGGSGLVSETEDVVGGESRATTKKSKVAIATRGTRFTDRKDIGGNRPVASRQNRRLRPGEFLKQ